MPATAAQLAELQAVNAEVNALPYATTWQLGEPADFWEDIRIRFQGHPASGTCIQYTEGKQHRLLELGWPAAMLTVVLCYTELNEYHAILAVDFPGEDGEVWFLDNRQPKIYRRDQMPVPYRLTGPNCIRQVPGKWQWEEIT